MSEKCGPITQAVKDTGQGIKDCAVATSDAIGDTKAAKAVKEGTAKMGDAISEKTHEAVKKVSEH